MSNIQEKIFKNFQDSNPEKFNEKLLNLKYNDDELKYLNIIFSSLDTIPWLTFKGIKKMKRRVFNINDFHASEIGKEFLIDIEKSDLNLYRVTIELEKDGKKEKQDIDFYYPRMRKGETFLINNIRYFPVFQLLDSGFYSFNQSVVLKTMFLAINLTYDEKKKFFFLNIFKRKVNVLLYFLGKFGYEEMLKIFKFDDEISLLTDEDLELFNFEDEVEKFKIKKGFYLVCNKEFYEKENKFIDSLLKCFNNRITKEKIFDIEYWKKKLGGEFTTSNEKIKKSDAILASLERDFDKLTKDNLNDTPEEDKVDIYHIIPYMMQHYEEIKNLDNVDLRNKRIRCQEYICYPLQPKINKYLYRITNSNKVKFSDLKTLRIPKGLLVKCATTNKLIRCDNSVNSINILSKLKFTQNGPQSQFDSGSVKLEFRSIHPSFVGRIDLLTTSSGDPGCSGSLVPFVKLSDNLHFI